MSGEQPATDNGDKGGVKALAAKFLKKARKERRKGKVKKNKLHRAVDVDKKAALAAQWAAAIEDVDERLQGTRIDEAAGADGQHQLNVTCDGYLLKRGEGSTEGFCLKRYFCLDRIPNQQQLNPFKKSDESVPLLGCIFYFSVLKDWQDFKGIVGTTSVHSRVFREKFKQHVKGVIPLHDAVLDVVMLSPEETAERETDNIPPYEFTLTTEDHKLFLIANSEEERRRWMRAIDDVITMDQEEELARIMAKPEHLRTEAEKRRLKRLQELIRLREERQRAERLLELRRLLQHAISDLQDSIARATDQDDSIELLRLEAARQALHQAIEAALAMHDEAQTAEQAAGFGLYTQEAKDELMAAIAEAQLIVDASVSQVSLDELLEATDSLCQAVEAFASSVTGDFLAALAGKLAEARLAHARAVEGFEEGQYVFGAKAMLARVMSQVEKFLAKPTTSASLAEEDLAADDEDASHVDEDEEEEEDEAEEFEALTSDDDEELLHDDEEEEDLEQEDAVEEQDEKEAEVDEAPAAASTSSSASVDEARVRAAAAKLGKELQETIDMFGKLRVYGGGLSLLNGAVQDAVGLLERAVVGSEPGQFPENAKGALIDATAEADRSLKDPFFGGRGTEDPDAVNDRIIEVYETLADSMDHLLSSVVRGKGADLLRDAVQRAEELLSSTEIGSEAGRYPQEAADELENQLVEARGVLDDEEVCSERALSNKDGDDSLRLYRSVIHVENAMDKYRASVIKERAVDPERIEDELSHADAVLAAGKQLVDMVPPCENVPQLESSVEACRAAAAALDEAVAREAARMRREEEERRRREEEERLRREEEERLRLEEERRRREEQERLQERLRLEEEERQRLEEERLAAERARVRGVLDADERRRQERIATEREERKEVDQFLKVSLKGQVFLKFNYSLRGKPQQRVVKVENDRICWRSGSKAWKQLKLDEVHSVCSGKRTTAFKVNSKAGKVSRDLCFSIVSRRRTLDLQARSKEERDTVPLARPIALCTCTPACPD
ncbi:MAG: hypothetical protein MHM6MM_003996 [Cercozoa sp. M6MM]